MISLWLWSPSGVSTGTSSIFSVHAPTWSHCLESQNSLHCYADDIQTSPALRFVSQISKENVRKIPLKLNSDKTKILIIGPDHLISSLLCVPYQLTSDRMPGARVCSSILTSVLRNTNKVIQTCYYHWRNTAKILSL